MSNDHQVIEALQTENQQLRQQLDALQQQRADWQAQNPHEQLLLAEFSLNHATDGVHWINEEGRQIYVNDALCRNLGYTRAEMLNLTVSDIDPNFPPQAFRGAWDMIKQQGPQVIESSLCRKDGSIMTTEVHASYLEYNGQEYICSFIRDMTGRKQQEEALQRSQDLLDKVMNSVPAVVYVKDTAGHYLLVNEQYLRVFHLTEEQIIGKTDYDIFPPEVAATLQANDRAIVTAGRSINSEELVPHDDGLHTYMSVKFPLFDAQGQMYAIGGISTDISEHKQAEQALHEEQEKYRSLVETIEGWIWEVNNEGVYTYSSPAVSKVLGYAPAEVVGKTLFDVMSSDEAERIGPVFAELTEQQLPVERFENRLVHKDGHEVIVETSGAPFFAADGTIRGYRGIDHDVTEQRRLQEERDRLQEQIIAAQQASLLELSTPLLPLDEDVLAMPLVGTLDSRRAQQVMETLLEGIALHQAEAVILDITGVKMVDTQVAQAILQTAQAVRLLGAQIILTGIQPQIAQTLVHLGADMSGIVTCSTLQRGILYALDMQGKLNSKNDTA
jgi:PAS domain S-box-containing protein